MAKAQAERKMQTSPSPVKAIVKAHGNDPGDLIAILQDLMAHYKYLPKEQLKEVAKELNIPENRVYAVATFFRAFSLEPKGKHDIHVCTGTACHVRGAPRLVDELKRMLNVDVRHTTKDGMFSLDTVNCVGSCALGPVITVDDVLYGKLTLKELRKVIKNYQDKERATDETQKRAGTGKPKGKSTQTKKRR